MLVLTYAADILDLRFECPTVPAKSLFSLGAKVLTKLDSLTPTGFRVSKTCSIVQYKETLGLHSYLFTVNVRLLCKKATGSFVC